jgi:cyclophilin family peptidyl-prolyl cis-trans isomerase
MISWSARGLALRCLAPVLIAGGLSGSGCGQKSQPDAARSEDSPPARQAEPASPASAKADARAEPEATPPVRMPAGAQRDRLHQSFAEATRPADNPPPDAVRPPDETVSKKPVFKILDEVARTWDSIRFVSPAGRKIGYNAHIETSLGTIEIALFPEQAPNHVRNFIALARAGYYDQLFFDRVRQEQGEGAVLESIEGGCPLGTGETLSGSIGYWLKEEFTPAEKMSHDEGVVGACRGSDADTAACRFYITLGKAPFLDGNYTIFGKVVRGLDVARTIYRQPLIIDDQDVDGARRPEKPIVIHKVTIHAQEMEASPK